MRSRSLKTPAQLFPIKNQDRSDMEVRHLPGHFGYSVPLFDVEKFTVFDDVSHSGHGTPLRV